MGFRKRYCVLCIFFPSLSFCRVCILCEYNILSTITHTYTHTYIMIQGLYIKGTHNVFDSTTRAIPLPTLSHYWILFSEPGIIVITIAPRLLSSFSPSLIAAVACFVMLLSVVLVTFISA